jgi:hypothetical protein
MFFVPAEVSIDQSTAIIVACIVFIACGLVWLFRALR